MGRTQEQRKAETRSRLVAAAADLFARKGFHAVSAEAVADRADRTTGALYSHFGGKQGLLVELLGDRRAEALHSVEVALDHTPDVDDRLRTLWRHFALGDGPDDDSFDAWALLEHELWLYAARQPEMGATLAERYRDDRDELGRGLEQFAAAEGRALARPAHQEAALAFGLLLGLSMQHRIDPASVPTDLVVEGLRRLLGLDRPVTAAAVTPPSPVPQTTKNGTDPRARQP